MINPLTPIERAHRTHTKKKDKTPEQIREMREAIDTIGNNLYELTGFVLEDGLALSRLLDESDEIRRALQENQGFQQELQAAVEFLISETDIQLLHSLPGEFDNVTLAFNDLKAAILDGRSFSEVANLRVTFRRSVAEAQASQANYYTAITTLQHTGQLVGVMLNLWGAPELSARIAPVFQGSISAINGIAAISGLAVGAAGSGPLAPYTSIALGAFMIYSAFSKTQATPEQQIMEAIIQVSDQIEMLRTEMHGRFDRIDEHLDKVLSLSIEQISYLSNIQGDTETLASGLSQITNDLRMDISYLNQNINEQFRDRLDYDVSLLQDNAFGRLAELLALMHSSDNAEAFALNDSQIEYVRQDYLSLRTWVSATSYPIVHTELPQINLGLLSERNDESSTLRATINATPVTGITRLQTALKTNPSSYLVNLLMEFSRVIGSLPPEGIPRLSNPQAYYSAAFAYAEYARKAKPIWQPSAMAEDKNIIRNLIWDGVNIASAAGLIKIDHNTFAFLGHQSILSRNALFHHEIDPHFQSKLPELLNEISDRVRSELKSRRVLGRMRLNLELLAFRFGDFNSSDHPTYIDDPHPHILAYNYWPGLGPLRLYRERSKHFVNTKWSEEWLKDQIYEAIKVDQEFIKQALNPRTSTRTSAVRFEWTSLLDAAVRSLFVTYGYDEIVEQLPLYAENTVVKGLVKQKLRSAKAEDFFDIELESDENFSETLRTTMLSATRDASIRWIGEIRRDNVLPGTSTAWLSETDAWWLLVKEYASFGFSDSEMVFDAISATELYSHNLFVELRWDELIALEHRSVLDSLAERHGYDWQDDYADSRAIRDALAALVAYGPREVMLVSSGRRYQITWDILLESVSIHREAYRAEALRLTEPALVLHAADKLSDLLTDCYNEIFWTDDIEPADSRILLAYEWVIEQDLLSKPLEFQGRQYVRPSQIELPNFIYRIGGIDLWIDFETINVIRSGRMPNLSVYYNNDKQNWKRRTRDQNTISVLRRSLDPRNLRGHWIGVMVPEISTLRDALGFGQTAEYKLQRALHLNDWAGIGQFVASGVTDSLSPNQISYILSRRAITATSLQQVVWLWQQFGCKEDLIFIEPKAIFDLDNCISNLGHSSGFTEGSQIDAELETDSALRLPFGKILQDLWPETDLRDARIFFEI